MTQVLISQFFERDLGKLKEEISVYNPETKLWIIKNEIKNSAGNLCWHITGGLLYFIGSVLGNTEYIRDRDAEFSDKNIPMKDLINRVDDTMKIIKNVLESLDEVKMKEKFPISPFNKEVSTEYFLLHLYGHLNYHLGQINYHRRLIN